MRLHLEFDLDTSVVQSQGDAIIELSFSAKQGRVIVQVHDIEINSSSSVLNMGSRVLSKPLRDLLAQQLSEAINQAILDLPQQIADLKRVEIIDVQD